MAFRLTDFQFGLLMSAVAACLVLPNLVYASLIAPLGPLVSERSLCVWMAQAALVTYAISEVCHLTAYVRERRWVRAARLIDG